MDLWVQWATIEFLVGVLTQKIEGLKLVTIRGSTAYVEVSPNYCSQNGGN